MRTAPHGSALAGAMRRCVVVFQKFMIKSQFSGVFFLFITEIYLQTSNQCGSCSGICIAAYIYPATNGHDNESSGEPENVSEKCEKCECSAVGTGFQRSGLLLMLRYASTSATSLQFSCRGRGGTFQAFLLQSHSTASEERSFWGGKCCRFLILSSFI